MKRRNFILTSTAGSASLLVGISTIACSSEKQKTSQDFNNFPLLEKNVNDLQQDMQSGKYSSAELTRLYLDRIFKIDKNGPKVNSIIEINPDAVIIAEECDKERKEGKVRGPLHGIPILFKDNINTADKMVTSAGSLALANSIAQRDAFIVKKLREAGAVILGKTNLSEWANFRSTRSSSGWSGRGGQTHNPYITDRNPCGSSSGSGVSVSSNFCALAIGTETDGSIVCPSSTNGIVGIKPTLGLWSRTGIIPIAHSQDTAGPMARNVSDAAILLGVLAGIDIIDEITRDSDGKAHADYTKFLNINGLKGARIGVSRNFFGFHERVDELMELVISDLKRLGAEIVDPANIEYLKECGEAENEVLHYEFKADLNSYLSQLPSGFPIRTLEQIIAFNRKSAHEELRFFGQETMIKSNEKGPLTNKLYIEALANLRKYSRELGIDATLKKHNLQAIIAPTGGPAWTTDPINGDRYLGGSSSPAACAGYPSITVPAGFIDELPIGVSFIGKAWSEPELISFAYAYEQGTKHRKPPNFLPTIPIE